MADVSVGQDAEVIEQAIEYCSAMGAFGATRDLFHPKFGPEQLPLPVSRVVPGLEATGVEFFSRY